MCFQDSSGRAPGRRPRQIDERAEVDDRGHHALADGALTSWLRNSLRTSDWVCSSQARRDRTTLLRFLSSSMILASISPADVGLQIADAAHLDQRGGQESAQADVEDQAALDDLDDGALDGLVLLLEFSSMVPQARSYWARFLDRIRAGPPW